MFGCGFIGGGKLYRVTSLLSNQHHDDLLGSTRCTLVGIRKWIVSNVAKFVHPARQDNPSWTLTKGRIRQTFVKYNPTSFPTKLGSTNDHPAYVAVVYGFRNPANMLLFPRLSIRFWQPEHCTKIPILWGPFVLQGNVTCLCRVL